MREPPRIYAMLEAQQEDHQSSMVKVEGNISKDSLSIQIDLGSTHIYVTQKIVESFLLEKRKHNISWLV